MKNLIKKSLFAVLVITLILSCFGLNFYQTKESKNNRYSGYGENSYYSTYSSVITETVSYTSKEESYIETVNAVPLYTQISDLPNSCGPTGGAIIVGYYDKYYDNLIPDFVPTLSSGKYKKNDRIAVPNLMRDLYTLMRTNVDDVGVGQGDCMDGLKTYVQNRGYSLSYSNIKSNNTINTSNLTSAINSNEPALIFCSKMDLYIITTTSNKDSITYNSYTGGHVVVGYGLYSVKYFNGANQFRSDVYIRVATGLPGLDHGFLKVAATDWCNAAYTVDIY